LSKAQFAKDKAKELISALHEGDADDKDLNKRLAKQQKQGSPKTIFLLKMPRKSLNTLIKITSNWTNVGRYL